MERMATRFAVGVPKTPTRPMFAVNASLVESASTPRSLRSATVRKTVNAATAYLGKVLLLLLF